MDPTITSTSFVLRKAQKNRRPNGRVTAGTTSGLCIGS
jgi:hypothetical protein